MTTQTKTTWRKVKLGEVLKIRRGASPRPIHNYIRTNGMPWLKIADITSSDSRFVDSTKEFIKDEGVSKSVVVKPGDLVLSNSATPGIPRFMRITACVHDGWLILAPMNNSIDKQFLYYRLIIDRKQLVSNVTGAIFDNLKTDVLRDHQVLLPPVADQKRIADILSAFDDKIELNNKISRTLEHMAQAIFKEWFVNFRFPGHEKVKMVDSELGKIPEGWEVKKIKDVAKVKKGLSYSSLEINEKSEGLPLVNLASFQRGGGYNPIGIKFYTGRYNEDHIVKPGDIVIAMTDLTSNREVIGHPARVPINSWDKILISLDVCSFETDELHREYLYYLMLRRNFAYQMASSAGGTNVAHLSKVAIEEFEFILPPKDILDSFKKFVEDIFRKQNLIEAENQKLAALRDLLLPKLMSGEMQV